MALFKDTAGLKIYCPPINRNTDWKTLAPIVDQAERKYILPLLGTGEFNALSLGFGDDDLSTEQETLLPYVQRTLAYYVYFEALHLLPVMLSDMGVVEHTSSEGTADPARLGSQKTAREHAIKTADIFADGLLDFLEDNHADYPFWKNSMAFTVTKELFINTATGFDAQVPIGNSKRVWLAIRSFVKMAENEYIRPALTDALYDDLKEKLKAQLDTALTPAYEALLLEIQPALAWLAIYKAMPFQAVMFTSGGMVQTTSNDGVTKQGPADRKRFETAMTHATNNGMSALRQLKVFLIKNCEDYPLFENESGAGQPSTELPDNSGNKSFMV